MTDYGIAVLAGGEGQRIGGHKPERLLKGKRLIEHVLDRIDAASRRCVICVRETEQVANPNVPAILDQADIRGPLAAVIPALAWANRENLSGIVTVPCDMPYLPGDLPSRLVNGSAGQSRPAFAVCGHQLYPVCAFWPTTVIDRVAAFATGNSASLRDALAFCGAVEVIWPDTERSLFLNINSAEDLHRAEWE